MPRGRKGEPKRETQKTTVYNVLCQLLNPEVEDAEGLALDLVTDLEAGKLLDYTLENLPHADYDADEVYDKLYFELKQTAEDAQAIGEMMPDSRRRFREEVWMHFQRDPEAINILQRKRKGREILQRYGTDELFARCDEIIGEQSKERYLDHMTRNTFDTSVAFVGLTKGNGVFVTKDGHIVTNAHVFTNDDDDETPVKWRAFIAGNGARGVAELVKMWPESDVALAKVKKLCLGSPRILHNDLSALKPPVFGRSDVTPVLLVGLLLDSDSNLTESFFTGIGWIEGYDVEEATLDNIPELCKLVQKEDSGEMEMGRMKHSCYTMWGTSGSPMFSCRAELVGIHQGWDNRKQDIWMTTRERKEHTIRKQYNRRGVPIWTIKQLLRNEGLLEN